MESKARLIHRTYLTYLPTTLPVFFYGLPDGKVYIIYSRFYEINFNNSGLEFVFAVHEEFLFDYKNEKLLTVTPLGQPINTVLVDKPEPKIKILKVYRNVNTYSQAQKLLNEIAHKMNCFPASA